ncbi:MAG: hypothetical protein WCV85_06640 [Patescibacteria group bacterium]|jgi:hypothetical protein
MEREPGKQEREVHYRDISEEFLSIPGYDFPEFLRTLDHEPALEIKVDWKDKYMARRLKAFLEDFHALDIKQKRRATIRATEAQWMEELNVFASGVKWEKV